MQLLYKCIFNTDLATKNRVFTNSGIDIFNQLPSGYIGLKELEDYYIFLNNPLRFHARYSNSDYNRLVELKNKNESKGKNRI